MSEPRWGRRSAAPPPRPAIVGALALASALLAFALPAAAMGKDGYRGIPAFVQVTSVEVTSSNAEVNVAHVCYRLSSALPAIELRANAADLFPAPRPAESAPRPGAARPARGKHRPPPAGVRSVMLDSTFQRIEPARLTFFSSIPRVSGSGAPRKVTLTSQRAKRLEYPELERVDFCETTEFEKALDPPFIQALFESPFLLGDLTGKVAFRLELVEETEQPPGPKHAARRPPGADRACSRPHPPGRAALTSRARSCRRRVIDVLSLSPAEHVVPIFGKNASIAAEQLTIEAAAASNAALFMDSGMPPELVVGESDAALNDTLLTTFGVQRARPSSSGDCRRFLGALREAVIARRSSKQRPASERPRPAARRAAPPPGGPR